MAATNHKEKPAKMQHNNPTQQFITTLKTINTKTDAKNVTEKQKQAFQALMRMAADPSGFQWQKRVQQMQFVNARKQRAADPTNKRPSLPQPKPKQRTRVKLKHRVAEMRRQAQFPLPPDRTTPKDAARRYGFIPPSERRAHPADYAKV
ncbi:uncharacterized protein LOC129717643 [Wyeomyia smithii]|uniref:uncharacterized protein LOC129717643 n=1 Tax=Wyeomyia smithii TaxID=174621 RepID=UPI0024680CE8|nr:uncharacterized protein LOC129717643 [Wyeomyia smithii]